MEAEMYNNTELRKIQEKKLEILIDISIFFLTLTLGKGLY